MPVEHRFDLAQRIVFCRAWGALTDHDLQTYQAAVSADPSFDPDLGQLYDGTGITDLQITSAALVLLLKQTRFAATARRAFVVASDVTFGMARMYSLLSGHESTIRVFRDRESAIEWLRTGNG